jgi:hypothetical protein
VAICSVAAVLVVQRVVTAPDNVVGFPIWWLAELGFCAIVFFATERMARRVVPLAPGRQPPRPSASERRPRAGGGARPRRAKRS